MILTKKRFLFAGLVLAASSIVTNVEAAAVLNTSALWADSGKSYHACNVTNIFPGAQNIAITLLDASNVVLTTTTVSVAANATKEVAWGSYTGFARCRIAAPYPEYVRANLTVFRWDATNSFYDSLAISEAR